MQAQWFESWFDSPWYPILYSHRDYSEAESFIEQLLAALTPQADAKFLDLACGRGRHSVFIHQHGFDVTGLDLSAASIADAMQSATEGLRFDVHDMRQPIDGQYDYILNLFTSFGYFAHKQENLQVLQHVAKSLASGGTFVLDFFNVEWVLQQMVAAQEITREGVHFSIRKRFEDGFILKSIHLQDGAATHNFEERVQGLSLADFEQLFEQADLEIEEIWGDYDGNAFVVSSSPRLILFARHKTKSQGTGA
jgi:SAM-dependent methyltransferase